MTCAPADRAVRDRVVTDFDTAFLLEAGAGTGNSTVLCYATARGECKRKGRPAAADVDETLTTGLRKIDDLAASSPAGDRVRRALARARHLAGRLERGGRAPVDQGISHASDRRRQTFVRMVERLECALDLLDLSGFEERPATPRADPGVDRIPANVVAVTVDREGSRSPLHTALAVKALHQPFLRRKSGLHSEGSGRYAVMIARYPSLGEQTILDLPRGYESFGTCHLFHRMGQVEDAEPSCCPDGVEDGSHAPMLAWRMDSEGPKQAER